MISVFVSVSSRHLLVISSYVESFHCQYGHALPIRRKGLKDARVFFAYPADVLDPDLSDISAVWLTL
jgi:hypothetical protein